MRTTTNESFRLGRKWSEDERLYGKTVQTREWEKEDDSFIEIVRWDSEDLKMGEMISQQLGHARNLRFLLIQCH